jgi:hypothetical protein
MAFAFQEKGVAEAAFDTSVKNYVFTHTPPPSAPCRSSSSHRRSSPMAW